MACVHFSCIPNEVFAAVVSQRQYNIYYQNVLLMQHHQKSTVHTHIPFYSQFVFLLLHTNARHLRFQILRF